MKTKTASFSQKTENSNDLRVISTYNKAIFEILIQKGQAKCLSGYFHESG